MRIFLLMILASTLFGKITTLALGDRNPDIFLSDLVILIAVAWLIIRAAVRPRARYLLTGVELPVILLAMALLLNGFVADDIMRWAAVYKALIFPIVVFFLTYAGAVTVGDLRRLSWALLGFGVILTFQMYVNSSFGEVLSGVPGILDKSLVRVPWGRSNYLASFFALLVPIAAGLYGSERDRRHRWLALLGAVVLLLGLASTLSRGGVLSLVASSIFVGSLALIRRWNFRFSGLILVLLGAILIAFLVRAPLAVKGAVVRATDLMDSGNRLRLDMWQASMTSFLDAPLLGVGLGNVGYLFEELLERREVILTAHNVYLQVLAEAGIVGFLPFAWIVVKISREIIRTQAILSRSPWGWLSLAVLASLCVALVNALYESSLMGAQYAGVFWMLVGMGFSLRRLHRLGTEGRAG